MITRQDGSRLDTRSVTFALPAWVCADTVHLVGDFNDWNTHANPLAFDEQDWKVTLELVRGCRYQFRYLLDGCRWCNDCDAEYYARNVLGGHNSVLET